ncbi:MAG TPA: STAS domain-containing protein [Anaerolineales bacterium]|nr:STAS domain-containing protein [Anaerolineales bacterium]
MEITTQEIHNVELITVRGRVDSVEAPGLAKALEAASRRGKHKIVVDMNGVEYMSSAGFRALGDAQRNSQRHQGGKVVLAQVPALIHEALETVGFTEYFHIEDSVEAALAFAENLPAGDSTSGD